MGSRILIRQDDGILAAQRRLRELGRIRTGWSVPYTKDGRELRRAVKSKTIVLTTAERGLLDEAAEYWGGTVERWQPQGNNPEVWRLVTERDGIEAILPPGDPLNQTLEMWSGGGCVRRCDGIVEKIAGTPCVCAAKFGPNFHEVKAKGGVPQVCKPTSRLSVFLDLGGLGLWRIETHSYYAMLEMAATVDLIKAKVGYDEALPIRLRIDPRTRLVDGKSTGYPVIVIELSGRGVVAQILSGSVDGLAIEARRAPDRPAIEAAPAQPPASLAAAAVVEEASTGAKDSTDAGEWDDDLAPLVFRIYGTTTEDEAKTLWMEIAKLDLTKDQRAALTQDFWAQKRRLGGRATDDDEAKARAALAAVPTPAALVWTPAEDPYPGAVDPPTAAAEPVDAEAEPDKVATWMHILAAAGQRGWDTDRTNAEMHAAVGVTADEADGWAMEQFLTHLRGTA